MLRLTDIRRLAGDKTLLDQVTLSIDDGDAIGLVGPSGSGKSTLLRAIAMLDPIESGSVSFRGQVIQGASVPAYRRSVVYLAQRPVMMDATVEENLRLAFSFAESAKSNATFDRDRVMNWLAEYGMPADVMQQDAITLSGGQQQAIALIRVMSIAPEVILLDEPTASLDAESVERFENLAVAWKREQSSRAWVWTSHDHSQVERMTDRVLKMSDGRILP